MEKELLKKMYKMNVVIIDGEIYWWYNNSGTILQCEENKCE